MTVIKHLPDRIRFLKPKALWERVLITISRDTSAVQPLVDAGHQLEQIARDITKIMLTSQTLPAKLNTQPDTIFEQYMQEAIERLLYSNADWRGGDEDEVLLVEELHFWWELLAAQEDFNFVRAYHGQIEQARGLQSKGGSDVSVHP